MSKRHKEKERRIEIVRNFYDRLTDKDQRTICMLLSREVPESKICKLLGINAKKLELIKVQIAVGLRQAGLEI